MEKSIGGSQMVPENVWSEVYLNSDSKWKAQHNELAILRQYLGRGEICIQVNLSTGQWVYLYTFFSNFRGQNRGEICIHERSKQEWNLYTKGQGKGDICLLYFINLKDFFRVKAKVTFVYFCQISGEICILFVNRDLWDEPNIRSGLVWLG